MVLTTRGRILGGPDLRGRVLADRYRLDRVAGCGGSATVYAARDLDLGRRVAVKVFHPEHARSEAQRRRIRGEAQLLARIDHLHVVPLLDFGEEAQTLLASRAAAWPGGRAGTVSAAEPLLFLVMPLLEGPTLRDLVLAGSIDWPRAVSLVGQLLSAVAALHGRGVLHRDLKAQNCLVTRRDGREHLQLVDLGLARITAPGLFASGSALPPARASSSGAIVGTLVYLAPEQARGQASDVRTDLYAVGVILFELLTRRVPFLGSEYAVLTAVVGQPPPTPSSIAPAAGIPAGLDAIVVRALAKDPAARFGSAGEFAAALADVLVDAGEEESVRARACGVASHAGCDEAQAALAAWMRFDLERARRAAELAARRSDGWSPLPMMLSALPDE